MGTSPESYSENPLATTWERPSLLPLTDAGRIAIEGFDGSSSDNPRLRCETTNILWDWSFDNPVNRIEQTATQITLIYGTLNLVRTIHLNQQGFPDNIEPSRAGYSIGRWENDELIVNTRGFLQGILSADTRTPHSDQFIVEERFRIDPDNGALIRSYVAEDPLFFTGQYKGSDTMFLSSYPYEAYNCDDRSFRSDR